MPDLHPNRAGWLWCAACGVGWMPSAPGQERYIRVVWPNEEQLETLTREVSAMIWKGMTHGSSCGG
jgi:hypothetical protein